MNRLETFKLKAPFCPETLDCYADDIAKLKTEIKELETLADAQIDTLYSDWSAARYAAGWMIIREEYIKEFRQWLLSEPGLEAEMYLPDWYY